MAARKSTAKKAPAKPAAAKPSTSAAAASDQTPAAEVGPRPVWEAGELRQEFNRRLRAWKLAQNPDLARALGEDD